MQSLSVWPKGTDEQQQTLKLDIAQGGKKGTD